MGAAQERLAKAQNYLEKARMSEALSENAIYYLALAKERVESAKLWLSLLKEIKKDYIMKEVNLRKRSDFYLSMAESLFVYANSINGYKSLLDSAEESLALAKDLYNNGYYAGSILSSLDSMVKSAVSIELIGVESKEELNSKIAYARNSAKNSIGLAEKVSMPILAYAYFEFAETSEGVYKLIYYKLSERIAKTIIALAGKEKVEAVNVSYNVPEIKTHEAQSIVESYVKKVPGFSAVMAIIALACTLLLMRRR